MDGRDDTLSELKEVPLTEFTQQDQARFALAPGDISWQQRDGKHFRLYRAGDPVDAPYLEKFFLNSQRLVCELLIDLPYFQTLKLYAQEYFHADLERQRIRTRDRLTSYLYPFLWEGDQEKSWLNLALAFHPELFRPELQALGFHENPDLFRRASLVGVLNVLGAMSLGYHRRNYLQDLYCLPFFQGISLRGKTTYHVEKALDAERISKGQFQNSLELLTETERELLIEHSRLDRELVEEKFSAYFENPSVVKMLAWQHERPKGGASQRELIKTSFPISSFGFPLPFVNSQQKSLASQKLTVLQAFVSFSIATANIQKIIISWVVESFSLLSPVGFRPTLLGEWDERLS